MKIATKMGDVSSRFSGEAIVYRVDPPVDGHKTIVVSAVSSAWARETYAFAWDTERGRVSSWSELSISEGFYLDPDDLMKRAGYRLAFAESGAEE